MPPRNGTCVLTQRHDEQYARGDVGNLRTGATLYPIARLTEQSAVLSVPSAHDDPLGNVLTETPGFAPSSTLVQAVTQNVLRALIIGFLHEPPLAYWYRNAFVVGGATLAFHDVLGRLLPRLEGTTREDCEMFARAPQAEMLGEWVAALYRLCLRVLPPSDAPELETPSPQANLSCRLPWAVRCLARELKGQHGLQLYLHGSLATCDATSYSDVDTLLIISHEWLQSGQQINELRPIIGNAQRWLYAYDPLQHHGFMVATALDLRRYANNYYPLDLLAYAVAIGPASPQRYRLRQSKEEDASLFRRLRRRLTRMTEGEMKAPQTRFALKLALSEMMLLPTYYLQLKGQVVYKRESFQAVQSILSEDAWNAIEALSTWRQEWARTPLEQLYRTAGVYLPGAVSKRILAQVRLTPTTKSDADRWSVVLPGIREVADELSQRLAAATV